MLPFKDLEKQQLSIRASERCTGVRQRLLAISQELAALSRALQRGQLSLGALRQGPPHLEYHAHVLAVGPHMLKVVIQAHAVLLVARIARLYLRQQRDLVACCVAVVRRALLHLREGHSRGFSRVLSCLLSTQLRSQLTCVDLPCALTALSRGMLSRACASTKGFMRLGCSACIPRQPVRLQDALPAADSSTAPLCAPAFSAAYGRAYALNRTRNCHPETQAVVVLQAGLRQTLSAASRPATASLTSQTVEKWPQPSLRSTT